MDPVIFPPSPIGHVRVHDRRDGNVAATVTHRVAGVIVGTFPLILPPTQNSTQTGAYALGFAGGAGIDVLLKSNIFVRGEWEYVQFPNIKYTNVSINTVRLGVGAKF